MKFFLDTANIDEIRDAASTGVLDGITTNPTLISKEVNSFEDQLLKICSLVNGPVSAETVSRDAAGMVDEGRHLAKLHSNIVVKCPMTKEGLKATKILSEERLLIFDQSLMSFAMGNAITLEDTNGNRKLLKKRQDEKIDNVAALMDAWIAFKLHKEDFE